MDWLSVQFKRSQASAAVTASTLSHLNAFVICCSDKDWHSGCCHGLSACHSNCITAVIVSQFKPVSRQLFCSHWWTDRYVARQIVQCNDHWSNRVFACIVCKNVAQSHLGLFHEIRDWRKLSVPNAQSYFHSALISRESRRYTAESAT